jgi:hypothetical protein
MSGDQSIKLKIEALTKELKIQGREEDFTLILEKELKKAGRTHSFYRVVGVIILAFSIIMSLVSLIADEGVFLGIEVKPHFYGAFMAVVMTSLIFINVGKLELKKDRLNTLMFLRGLKNE